MKYAPHNRLTVFALRLSVCYRAYYLFSVLLVSGEGRYRTTGMRALIIIAKNVYEFRPRIRTINGEISDPRPKQPVIQSMSS